MRLLLAAVLAASIVATACEDKPEPEMLAVIAESMLQRDCAPVPLRLVDVPSGDVRLGPADRWVTFAVSPSGDRVAAVRMDYDLCGPDVPEEEQTFTLVMVDTETLDVTELRTQAEIIGHIHWSPDGQYLALVGIFDVFMVDADSGDEIRRDARRTDGQSLGGQRAFVLWPTGGRYLFVFIDGLTVFGLPRDPTLAPTEWRPDCREGSRNPFRLRLEGSTTMVVDHYCTSQQLEPDFIFKTEIDLDDDSIGPREPSPEGETWINENAAWYGAADDGFAGGMVASGLSSLGGDTSGRLLFTTVVWSPQGVDVRELPRDEIPSDTDLKATIVIRDADGETIEVPVELEYPMPIFASGPILDVTALD